MIDANTHQFCQPLIAILSSLLLPLFVMAALSALVGAPIVGSALSEALELAAGFVLEILLRFLQISGVVIWNLLRLLARAAIIFYGWAEGKITRL